MATSLVYTANLQRQHRQHLTTKIVKRQIEYILKRALAGSRGKNWKSLVVDKPIGPKVNGFYTTSVAIQFRKIAGQKRSEQSEWHNIYRMMARAAQSKQHGGWSVQSDQAPEDMPKIIEPKAVQVQHIKETKDYAPINIDRVGHFDELYGLDYHIQLAIEPLHLANQTNLEDRIHTVLKGPPGCGKTELLKAMANMLGKEKINYLWFDATSATQAGAIQSLMSSPFIPPVLFVEEIEKTEETALRWMLGLLDKRGEIRRLNFRVGNQAKNVRMVCYATVNDEDRFKKAMSGALESRFSNKLYFDRPTPETMRQILAREVRKLQGRMEWIDPTIEFCYDVLKVDDPRTIIPILKLGRDKLLTLEHQRAVIATLPPEDKARIQQFPLAARIAQKITEDTTTSVKHAKDNVDMSHPPHGDTKF